MSTLIANKANNDKFLIIVVLDLVQNLPTFQKFKNIKIVNDQRFKAI